MAHCTDTHSLNHTHPCDPMPFPSFCLVPNREQISLQLMDKCSGALAHGIISAGYPPTFLTSSYSLLAIHLTPRLCCAGVHAWLVTMVTTPSCVHCFLFGNRSHNILTLALSVPAQHEAENRSLKSVSLNWTLRDRKPAMTQTPTYKCF